MGKTWFCWGEGSSLHIVAGEKEPTATIYQWPGQDPLQRKLSRDAQKLYETVASLPECTSADEHTHARAEYARRMEMCMDVDEIPNSDSEYNLLLLRTIWRLVSIFFVDEGDDSVVESLVEWLHKHYAVISGYETVPPPLPPPHFLPPPPAQQNDNIYYSIYHHHHLSRFT